MEISELLEPRQVFVNARAKDKTDLLQQLSKLAAPLVGIDADTIFQALSAREELGSTGLGQGFALPHARIEGLERLFGMFVRLARPIEFQAIDEKRVDLVFLLLIPDGAHKEHLAALAAISRLFRNQESTRILREAVGTQAVYQSLTHA